jgi:hypothetical protein
MKGGRQPSALAGPPEILGSSIGKALNHRDLQYNDAR